MPAKLAMALASFFTPSLHLHMRLRYIFDVKRRCIPKGIHLISPKEDAQRRCIRCTYWQFILSLSFSFANLCTVGASGERYAPLRLYISSVLKVWGAFCAIWDASSPHHHTPTTSLHPITLRSPYTASLTLYHFVHPHYNASSFMRTFGAKKISVAVEAAGYRGE